MESSGTTGTFFEGKGTQKWMAAVRTTAQLFWSTGDHKESATAGQDGTCAQQRHMVVIGAGLLADVLRRHVLYETRSGRRHTMHKRTLELTSENGSHVFQGGMLLLVRQGPQQHAPLLETWTTWRRVEFKITLLFLKDSSMQTQ